MPSDASSLMEAAGLRAAGKIAWGAPVPESRPGIYVISLRDGPRKAARIDREKIAAWMRIAAGMELRGAPVTDCERLGEHLERFWHTDETVLYIGLAGTSLKNRTRQFCNHIVGHNKPHAGGFWLKLLRNDVLANVDVHWAPTPTSDAAEFVMLSAFETGRGGGSSALSTEPHLPFANLKIEVPIDMNSPWGAVRRRLKKHDLRGHTVEPLRAG